MNTSRRKVHDCKVSLPNDLLAALRTLNAESVGDFIYVIREREGLGWDGPRVTAWSTAVGTIAAYVERYKPTEPTPPRVACTRTPGCVFAEHSDGPCDTEVPF